MNLVICHLLEVKVKKENPERMAVRDCQATQEILNQVEPPCCNYLHHIHQYSVGVYGEEGITIKGLKQYMLPLYGDVDIKDESHESKTRRRHIDERVLQQVDDGVNVNTHYRTKSNQFFLVRHSQSSSVPDCPTGTSTLWSGYSLYSFFFGSNNTITRDLGSVDSCVQLVNQAYFSYCSGASGCNTISTVLWLSNRNISISRCSVCLVSSSPITLHSQSTIPPSCPPNWSSLWAGYSHIQVSEFIRIQ